MIFKQFNSSTLHTMTYDEDTNKLEVTFKRGAVYRYSNVPQDIVNELINAESSGKYFNANIAKLFKYEKIGG